mgnify:CR=1 FL=1
MNKEFVPYEQALALKELEFDEPCFSFYDSEKELYESEGVYKKDYNVFGEEVLSPLYQQAFRWFREKYNIDCYVESKLLITGDSIYDYTILVNEGDEWEDDVRYKTYEEAELACLIKLIEIANKIKYSSSDVPTYYN